MTAKVAWELIFNKLKDEGSDFPTVPSNKRIPVWFHAEIANNIIIINEAKNMEPSSKLTGIRKISYRDFENIFSHFLLWRKDPSIRKEIKSQSRNTAYIFGLIADIDQYKRC